MNIFPWLAASTLIVWSAQGFGGSAPEPNCPIRGEVIQWVADYCMFTLETDDEIAASDCINRELQRPFTSQCAAKQYFKASLCRLAVDQALRSGSAQQCLDDPDFEGSTVRNQGVGS